MTARPPAFRPLPTPDATLHTLRPRHLRALARIHGCLRERIPPRSRAAYLAWLADGRRYPQAPIGYVFVYFYGLERWALHDLRRDRSSAAFELPIIYQEIRRLLALYGGHKAFKRYAGNS